MKVNHQIILQVCPDFAVFLLSYFGHSLGRFCWSFFLQHAIYCLKPFLFCNLIFISYFKEISLASCRSFLFFQPPIFVFKDQFFWNKLNLGRIFGSFITSYHNDQQPYHHYHGLLIILHLYLFMYNAILILV